MQNAVLMAVPFDAQRQQSAGAPVAMLDGVMQAAHTDARDAETGMGQCAISASGNLIYAAGGISPAFVETLVRVDRKGAETELNIPKGPYGVVRMAPDGQRIAIARQAETNSREASTQWGEKRTRIVLSPASGPVELYLLSK